jgi:hypothetical protein
MPELSKTFLEYREIAERQAFDPECGIAVEDFAGLVGEYHFVGDAEYPCQVMRDGRRCDEDHKNGWLGRKKDGREALIGSTCGPKNFKASLVFVAERRRLNNEHSIQTSLHRLKGTLCNPGYAEEVTQIRERLRRFVSGLDEYREALPGEIVATLIYKATNDQSDVVVRFRHDDEDDNGKPIVRWEPERIGFISGLSVWHPKCTHGTFAAINEIRAVLRVAKAAPEEGRRKLKEWADTLDGLPGCKRQVDSFESQLEAFGNAENLKLLCLLLSNQYVGVSAAGVVIERATGTRAAPGAPRQMYNELRKAVSTRSNGRPFKI